MGEWEMITKPEDAEPRHMVYSETTDAAQLGGVTLRGGDGFTAKECAEIAMAYGNAVAAEMTTHTDKGTGVWEAKFKEWENAT